MRRSLSDCRAACLHQPDMFWPELWGAGRKRLVGSLAHLPELRNEPTQRPQRCTKHRTGRAGPSGRGRGTGPGEPRIRGALGPAECQFRRLVCMMYFSICYHMVMEESGLSKIKANQVSCEVYDELLARLEAFAQFEVENKKTSLHIVHGRAFLGVHPRKDGLLLNIVTNAPITSARIKKTERVSANRYHNEIAVTAAQDLDGELLTWIEQAYGLTAAV